VCKLPDRVAAENRITAELDRETFGEESVEAQIPVMRATFLRSDRARRQRSRRSALSRLR
jgi:hypothetical protein